jgi:hypothetical protein
MLIRFFLALLALLTGISSAQAAVPVSSAQTAVGVALTPIGAQSDFARKQKITVNFDTIIAVPVRWLGCKSKRMLLSKRVAAHILPVVFVGDRQRA